MLPALPVAAKTPTGSGKGGNPRGVSQKGRHRRRDSCTNPALCFHDRWLYIRWSLPFLSVGELGLRDGFVFLFYHLKHDRVRWHRPRDGHTIVVKTRETGLVYTLSGRGPGYAGHVLHARTRGRQGQVSMVRSKNRNSGKKRKVTERGDRSEL